MTTATGKNPAAESFRLLFYRTDGAGNPQPPASPFLRHIEALLPAESDADRAFQLNALARFGTGRDFAAAILGEIFDCCVANGVLPQDYSGEKISADAEYIFSHAMRILQALPGCVPQEKSLILPRAGGLFAALPEPGDAGALAQMVAKADPFAVKRVFTCRDGKFFPVTPSSLKDTSRFYGFPGVRQALAAHFREFACGESNLPLIINSLPGYGKTSMVVSHALACPEVTVILPDPDALENSWHTLIDALAARQDHKFVIFFDDIDPRQVDWYSFRTNVGGAFTPPANIMPVLAANYDFPPSILSRGRKISYPVFDEERCMEMIEDFLLGFGMKHPPRNIVSLMGAQYTEEFGQKKFTELSPRTLMRYLARFENDPRRRKQIVELASGSVITRPDGELFYEFNISLMRSLYGEQYIQDLLKERLREL